MPVVAAYGFLSPLWHTNKNDCQEMTKIFYKVVLIIWNLYPNPRWPFVRLFKDLFFLYYKQFCLYRLHFGGCCGHDRMVVEFTTTCAISAYHHERCKFESHSRQGVLDTALCDKVVSDLWHVVGFLRVLRFPPLISPPRFLCIYIHFTILEMSFFVVIAIEDCLERTIWYQQKGEFLLSFMVSEINFR